MLTKAEITRLIAELRQKDWETQLSVCDGDVEMAKYYQEGAREILHTNGKLIASDLYSRDHIDVVATSFGIDFDTLSAMEINDAELIFHEWFLKRATDSEINEFYPLSFEQECEFGAYAVKFENLAARVGFAKAFEIMGEENRKRRREKGSETGLPPVVPKTPNSRG